MSTYGPRSSLVATPTNGVDTVSAAVGAGFEIVIGSRAGFADAVPLASTNGFLGRAASQHSVSSGINSFGPLHEEKTSLG